MPEPDVSVIIPAFNAERWIGDALRSVAIQKGVSLQVIVVDDGSTDHTVDVVRSVGGDGVVILGQEHGGVSRARNAGTAESRGRFVQYLDADDVLAPNTLADRVHVADDRDAGVIYTDWIRWTQQSTGAYVDSEIMTRTLGACPELELFTDAWWPPGALLYRHGVALSAGPWREDLPVIQDARFQLDAARTGATFVHLPKVGMRYRVSGGETLSRRDPRAFLIDCFHNATTLHDAWSQGQALDVARQGALLRVYSQVARGLYEHDRSLFEEVHRRLMQLDPKFVPVGPRALRALSRLIGYPAAEYVALWWRRTKGRRQA